MAACCAATAAQARGLRGPRDQQPHRLGNGRAFLGLAAPKPIRTELKACPLERADQALGDLRAQRLLVP